MDALRQAEVADAFALVAEASTVETLEGFPAEVLPRVRTLLRADFASFVGGSPGPSVWRFDPEGALRPLDDDEALLRMAEHPLVSRMARTRDGRAMRVSDVMSVRAFERLGIYQDRFRPVHGRFQLLAGLAFTGPVPSGIGFARTASDFTERDRSLLELLRLPLAAAYRAVAERVEAGRRLEALERGLEVQGRAVAIVRDGRLEPLSGNAESLLRRWFGDADPPLPAPGRTVEVEREDARLRLSTVGGDPAAVLLDETRFRPDAGRAESFGLTVRETEILGLVARGLSDAEIARELFLSVRTVEKHLANAYRKLGTSDRRAAVALLLAR